MKEEREENAICQSVDGLIRGVEETLISMGPCPKQRRLERIYFGLKREQRTLEKAARESDTVNEHKVLYQILSKIARYYRTLGTIGQG